MNKIIPGLVEKYSDKDFIRKDDIIETPSKNFLNTGKLQYNQDEVHKNSCFLHGPFTAITALTGQEFTFEERIELVENAWKEDWADPEWGGMFSQSCRFVCNYYNKNKAKPGQTLTYYRIPKSDYSKFMEKGYLVVTGYTVQDGHKKDREDDGIYNESQGKYGKEYGGHCICKGLIDGKVNVIDNYLGINSNIVKDEGTLKDFANGYVFMLKENVKDGYEALDLSDKTKKLSERAEVIRKKQELNNK